VTRRLTVTQWFALIVGLLLVVAAAGLVAGLLALGRLSDRRDLLADRIDPSNVAALRLSSALLNEETGLRGFVLGRDPVYLEPFRSGREAEQRASRTLDGLADHESLRDVRADLATVTDAADRWRTDYAEPAIAAVQDGRAPPPAALGKERFDLVRAALARQQEDLAAVRAEARDNLDDTATFVTVMFVGAGVLLLFSLVAAAVTLRQVIVRPLALLADEVREVAHGDFDRAVESSGPREIATLGADVEAMRGRIVAEVAALRDAERALLEQARELQRSNEELEQFAYVASHDLQEPLRKVASFTQMLERRYKGQLDERADRYIAFAVDGAKRMQELINDLLDFSRVGRTTAPHERVETGELVEEAKRRLSAALQESDGVVVADGLPAVVGDAGLLTAVFQNLISNAIKFRGDAPPRVTITAEPDGRFWRFTVTDCGIGVEDQYAERIFVIFQRLHSRDAYEGTGIGLAMCRKIIEYHGGHIWLAPAAPDRGAQFTFTLPAGDPEEDPAP
jgi:signal transduction histidine kinase